MNPEMKHESLVLYISSAEKVLKDEGIVMLKFTCSDARMMTYFELGLPRSLWESNLAELIAEQKAALAESLREYNESLAKYLP